jgi:hypothetical protein
MADHAATVRSLRGEVPLHPFMAAEWSEVALEKALEHGLVPLVVTSPDPEDVLRGYVALYLEHVFQAIEVKNGAEIRPADRRALKAFVEDYPESRTLLL